MGLGEPREMLDRYLEHIYSEQQAFVSMGIGAPDDGSLEVDAVLGFEAFQPWFDAREEIVCGYIRRRHCHLCAWLGLLSEQYAEDSQVCYALPEVVVL